MKVLSRPSRDMDMDFVFEENAISVKFTSTLNQSHFLILLIYVFLLASSVWIPLSRMFICFAVMIFAFSILSYFGGFPVCLFICLSLFAIAYSNQQFAYPNVKVTGFLNSCFHKSAAQWSSVFQWSAQLGNNVLFVRHVLISCTFLKLLSFRLPTAALLCNRKS